MPPMVYPVYNARPYHERGWPTFEQAAAKIVLAHITQRQQKKRGTEALPPHVEQAVRSGEKLVVVDFILAGRPEEVKVRQSPEQLLKECMTKLLSAKATFFTGRGDRSQVVQMLTDFEDSIAVEFDEKRASNLSLCGAEVALATREYKRARRERFRQVVNSAMESHRRQRIEEDLGDIQQRVAVPLLLDSKPKMVPAAANTLAAASSIPTFPDQVASQVAHLFGELFPFKLPSPSVSDTENDEEALPAVQPNDVLDGSKASTNVLVQHI